MPSQHSTRITAVRHGETAWNRDTRIQGSLVKRAAIFDTAALR